MCEYSIGKVSIWPNSSHLNPNISHIEAGLSKYLTWAISLSPRWSPKEPKLFFKPLFINWGLYESGSLGSSGNKFPVVGFTVPSKNPLRLEAVFVDTHSSSQSRNAALYILSDIGQHI